MGAARKLNYRNAPRTPALKKKGTTRTLRKGKGALKLVKGGGFDLNIVWSDAGMTALQRKCYFLRRAHDWTQEELAEKAGLCAPTIARYEDEERPMLAPRLKTFIQIFRKGFGAKVTVTHE